jgi:hypothetical protein
MRQIRNYGDLRQTASCAYCGGDTATRDHVPSRVLLDEPYPENLPVVPACDVCNQGFSADEEYVACLVECILSSSTYPSKLSRNNIQRILTKKRALRARLTNAQRELGGIVQFRIEDERVRNVFVKLGKGHSLFELNEPQYEMPSHLTFATLNSLEDESLKNFEAAPSLNILPEVGSRAMQRLFSQESKLSSSWVVVQPGRYRYLASVADTGIIVRIVLSEFLAGEIVWNQ